MTYPPPERALPEIETTRVSSGSSARWVALAVAGVLIGVVGFVVVNRPPAPVAPPVAAAPSPEPSPSPPRTQLQGNDGVMGRLPFVHPPGPVDVVLRVARDYGYAAVIGITGGDLYTALKRDSAELYRASVVLTWSDLGKSVAVDVGRAWSAGGPAIYESFGSWSVPLRPMRKGRGLVKLLVAHVPPDATLGLSGALAAGYTFTVMGRHDGENLTLLIELVWPAAARFGDR